MKHARVVLFLLFATALGAALLAYDLSEDRLEGAVYGGVGGLVTGAVMLTYRPLARRLGRYTAVAALAVLGATMFGMLALLTGICADTPGGDGSCSGSEIGEWVLVGALLPIAWAALIMPPMIVGRTLQRIWRFGRRRKDTRAAQGETQEAGSRRRSRADDEKRRRRRAQRTARRQNR